MSNRYRSINIPNKHGHQKNKDACAGCKKFRVLRLIVPSYNDVFDQPNHSLNEPSRRGEKKKADEPVSHISAHVKQEK